MELFEKLNAFAKTAADKTNEAGRRHPSEEPRFSMTKNPSGNWRLRSALTITKNSQPEKR